MATDFILPELGENVAAGDVLRVLVKPGDTIAKDQPVLELETDKATIEVPSSVAGTVKEIKVKAGEKVKVGQAILSVDDGGAAAAPKTAAAPAAAAKAEAKAAAKAEEAKAAGPQPAAPDVAADRARGAEERVRGAGVSEERVRGTGASEERVRGAGAPGLENVKVVDINRGAR